MRGGAPIKSTKKTFWQIFDEFLLEKAKVSKPETIIKYSSTKKSMTGFEQRHYPLSFENMTMNFYLDYKIYCWEILKHLNNTVSKNLSNIKTFLAWAENHPERFNTMNDYKKFKLETEVPEPIYLNESELESFEDFYSAENNSLMKSKDIFVFQSYIGQRIGDVLSLKKQDIRLIENGPAKEWVLYQHKGNKKHPLYIPILDKAEEILNRYCHNLSDEDLVFSNQSLVTLNKNIKVIAKAVNIDTIITKVNYCGRNRIQTTRPKYNLIGTHTARKTFISLSLERGIRPEQLKAITGHSTVDQMGPYIGIDKSNLIEDIKEKWNK
jgi:integrase